MDIKKKKKAMFVNINPSHKKSRSMGGAKLDEGCVIKGPWDLDIYNKS